MDETYQTENASNKKVLYISAVVMVLILILGTIGYMIAKSAAKPKAELGTSQGVTGTMDIERNLKTSATQAVQKSNITEVKFNKWVEPKIAPTSLASSNIYTYKQNYSKTEIEQIASKFNVTKNLKNEDPSQITYYNDANKNLIALNFDQETGAFNYMNTKGVPLPNTSTNMDDKIIAYLRSINLYDDTMKVTANYKKKGLPDITFYEIHRDWSKVGMPILNFNGLFNIAEDQTLRTLTLNTKDHMPSDTAIYATSDNTDLYKRADDFNTMTITISDTDKYVLSIKSNIRQLVNTKTKPASLQTYGDALAKLKNNKYDLLFTSPSGAGQVAWTKIYPNNKAIADQAIISESTYAYLEELPSEVQTELKPYILFRGTSVLDSGYSVNFIAAVDISPVTANARQKVLGANTYLAQNTAGRGQQEAVITSNPVTNTPVTGVTPTGPVVACEPQVSSLQPTIDFTDTSGRNLKLGLGPYVRYTIKNGETIREPRNEQRWYYIPPEGYSSKTTEQQRPILEQAFNTFLANIAALNERAVALGGEETTLYCPDKNNPGHTDKSCKRTWELLWGDFQTYRTIFNQGCPLIFSGLSPVIFIYGPEAKSVSIRSWSSLTYSDPGTSNSMWNIKLGSNNAMTVNNLSRQFIYYEYAPVQFNKPQLGWNISKKDLSIFVNTISEEMKLSSLEIQRLNYEIENAAREVKSESLFIGIIDQNELNRKIPLSVNPAPESIQRVHFYIGKMSNQSVKAPNVIPVERNKYMVLEFGAVPEK